MPEGIQACLGRRMALLRPNQDVVNPRFLLYYYLSPAFQRTIQQRTVHGATVPRISLSDMPHWPVTIPPMPKQLGIAEVLGALDDKIAANARAESLAEQFIHVQYRHLLSNASTVPFFEAVDVDFGEPFSGAFFSDIGTGLPLIRIRDLKTFRSQIWTTERRPREVLVMPGDVVVGMDAEFRATWWLGDEGLLNQRVCRIRGKGFGNALAAEAVRMPLASIEGQKSATTVIHLNKSDMLRSVVRLPDGAGISEFERLAEPVLRHRVALARERARLSNVRDSLLPLLMSGKVRVKDAEAVVGEVL